MRGVPAIRRTRCRGLVALVIGLVSILALAAPATSSARPRVLASASAGSPNELRLAARAPRSSNRVVFDVDGKTLSTDRHFHWRFGPHGYLRAGDLNSGRHRIVIKIYGRHRVRHVSKVVYLLPQPAGGKNSRWRMSKPHHPPSGGNGDGSGNGSLVEAGFENGFTGWNMDGVGDVRPTISGDVVETGSEAGKVVLTGTQSRSELMLDGSGGPLGPGTVVFHEGDERYYAFSFLIRQMVYGHPGAHNAIMQFHSGDGAPFGLMLWDYAGDDGKSGGKGLWSIGGAMGGGNRYLAPVKENQWNDVVVHFKASRQGAGFYELYLNGQLIDSRKNISMIDPADSSGYIKTGLYRNGAAIPGTSDLRVDSVALGTTMAQVAVP